MEPEQSLSNFYGDTFTQPKLLYRTVVTVDIKQTFDLKFTGLVFWGKICN